MRQTLIENSLFEKNKNKISELTAQVKELEKSLQDKIKEVKELNTELQNKKFEELKNISIYETKLKEAKAASEHVPDISNGNLNF